MTNPPGTTPASGLAMAGQQWAAGDLVGFDLETTGTDPLRARVVTAAVVREQPGGALHSASRTWLVDPGIAIPEAAAAVHGISTEHARAHGGDYAAGVGEIGDALAQAWSAGLPIVIFNAAYDLTLLEAELTRLGLTPLTARPGFAEALVIDPLVIDRAVDRYRRGKRTLGDMTAHYGVVATDAHSADGDAIATCRLARAIAGKYADVGGAEPAALRSQQQVWAGEWATRFQAYLRSKGNPDTVIDGTWPVRTR